VRACLDEQACRSIHEATLRLLEEVGCAVLDPEALALLKENGIQVEGERARSGEDVVAARRLLHQLNEAKPEQAEIKLDQVRKVGPPTLDRLE
jgi:trimethylamine:corrinoid methyltransferase-like protein